MKKILSLFAAAAILLTAGCGTVPDTDEVPEATATPAPVEISFFTDPDLSNVLNDIYKKYRENHPELSIVFRAEPADEIQRLLEADSSCDIVFSSSQDSINSLGTSGLIVSDSVTPLIENSAVLIRAAKNDETVTGFADLNNAENIAVMKKDTPLGSYSYELLNDYGIKIKTDEYDSIDDIINAVAEGDNETGIIYSTDAALARDDVKRISDPDDDTKHTTAEYTLALVNNSSANPGEQKAAAAFFKYLLTNASRNSFIYYGFTMKQ